MVTKYKNIDGERIKMTDEELAEIISSNTLSIDELIQVKLTELKDERDEYKEQNSYDSDYLVTNILTGLGDFSDEEVETCKEFFNDLITKYDSYKDQILACTTEDELDTITISFEDE